MVWNENENGKVSDSITEDKLDYLKSEVRRLGNEAKAWREDSQNRDASGKLNHITKTEIFPPDGSTRKSPCTVEDVRLGQELTAILNQITPGVPVINEESPEEANLEIRQRSDRYWTIDPIDGTSNFIDPTRKHYGLLIGLVEQGRPTFGITYYPEYDMLNYVEGDKAYMEMGGQKIPLQVKPWQAVEADGSPNKLETTPQSEGAIYGTRWVRNSEGKYDVRMHAADVSARFTTIRNPESQPYTAMRGGIISPKGQHIDTSDFPDEALVLLNKAQLASLNGGGYDWDYAAREAIFNAAGGEFVAKYNGKPPVYGKTQPEVRGSSRLWMPPVYAAHPQTLEALELSKNEPAQGQGR